MLGESTALLSAIDSCPAVRNISDTHETEQEAHQDIGAQLSPVGLGMQH